MKHFAQNKNYANSFNLLETCARPHINGCRFKNTVNITSK